MTTTNNPAPVEQCDRQAFKQLRGMFGPTVEAAVDRGEYDDDWQMQLLANHRLRATGGEASRIRSEGVGLNGVGASYRRDLDAWVLYENDGDRIGQIDGSRPKIVDAILAALRPAATEERSAPVGANFQADKEWLAQQPAPSVEAALMREAMNLAYGLLWYMQIDTRDDNLKLASDARKALLSVISEDDQADGIVRAMMANPRFAGAA